MRQRLKIHLRAILLIHFLVLAVASILLGLQEPEVYETAAAEVEEEYNYQEIQDLVTLPSSSPELSMPAEKEEPEKQSSTPTMPTYQVEDMMAINRDFKGWLWIPGTDVNYPVVQTTDNKTYLSTSFQGSYSGFGTLFLDKDCSPESRNRVIHGHNMGNGRTEMFSSLLNYQDVTWAEEREYAYFIEPEDTERCEYRLFAVLNFSVYNLDVFNYLQAEFETDEVFHTFVSYLKDNSLYNTDFTPQHDILILSTCNKHYGTDNRLLVCYGRDPSDTLQE